MADDTGFDAVPQRYLTKDGKEVIDVVRAALGDQDFIGYCKGTAYVYRMRAGKKANAENDDEKALWYEMMARHVENPEKYLDPRSYRK